MDFKKLLLAGILLSGSILAITGCTGSGPAGAPGNDGGAGSGATASRTISGSVEGLSSAPTCLASGFQTDGTPVAPNGVSVEVSGSTYTATYDTADFDPAAVSINCQSDSAPSVQGVSVVGADDTATTTTSIQTLVTAPTTDSQVDANVNQFTNLIAIKVIQDKDYTDISKSMQEAAETFIKKLYDGKLPKNGFDIAKADESHSAIVEAVNAIVKHGETIDLDNTTYADFLDKAKKADTDLEKKLNDEKDAAVDAPDGDGGTTPAKASLDTDKITFTVTTNGGNAPVDGYTVDAGTGENASIYTVSKPTTPGQQVKLELATGVIKGAVDKKVYYLVYAGGTFAKEATVDNDDPSAFIGYIDPAKLIASATGVANQLNIAVCEADNLPADGAVAKVDPCADNLQIGTFSLKVPAATAATVDVTKIVFHTVDASGYDFDPAITTPVTDLTKPTLVTIKRDKTQGVKLVLTKGVIKGGVDKKVYYVAFAGGDLTGKEGIDDADPAFEGWINPENLVSSKTGADNQLTIAICEADSIPTGKTTIVNPCGTNIEVNAFTLQVPPKPSLDASKISFTVTEGQGHTNVDGNTVTSKNNVYTVSKELTTGQQVKLVLKTGVIQDITKGGEYYLAYGGGTYTKGSTVDNDEEPAFLGFINPSNVTAGQLNIAVCEGSEPTDKTAIDNIEPCATNPVVGTLILEIPAKSTKATLDLDKITFATVNGYGSDPGTGVHPVAEGTAIVEHLQASSAGIKLTISHDAIKGAVNGKTYYVAYIPYVAVDATKHTTNLHDNTIDGTESIDNTNGFNGWIDTTTLPTYAVPTSAYKNADPNADLDQTITAKVLSIAICEIDDSKYPDKTASPVVSSFKVSIANPCGSADAAQVGGLINLFVNQ